MQYNKVILGGNLTRDPELRYTQNQTPVVDFGLAVNRKWKDREEVLFIDCTMFGQRAEVINKHFRKGGQILVEGRLVYETWETKDGGKRSKHKIVAENFEFVGKRDDSAVVDGSWADRNQGDVVDDADIPF